MHRKKAELRLADHDVGSFLLYLNRYIPNLLFVAAVVDDPTTLGKKTVHKQILRTRQGYIFADETKGASANAHELPIPSLFEHCAWYIVSKRYLVEAAEENLPDETVILRLRDVKLLVGLWGVKNYSLHLSNENNSLNNDNVYATLGDIAHKNKSWLINPVAPMQHSQQ